MVISTKNKGISPAPATAGAVQTSTLSNFITAGLGGMWGWCVVHPFNTVAVRMSLASMSQAPGTPSLSFPSFFMQNVKQHGLMNLYNGLSAGVLRQVFYASTRFGLFEVMRDEYKAKYGEVDILGRLVCGVLSGSVAALVSCPAEVTLVRLSNDATLPEAEKRNYKGVTNAFTRIFAEEGPLAFFRGSGPFVNRAMLVGAVQVGTFDHFKQMYSKQYDITHPALNVFCAAMTSGLLYSLITMPLETCKNRMAFQRPDPTTGTLPFTTTTQALRRIATTEGVLMLWNGFPPYYLRCGGHTVAMFMTVQWLRERELFRSF